MDALEHLRYFTAQGSWGLVSIKTTASGKPDTEDVDYNDGVFSDDPSIYDRVEIEGCFDSFFAPPYKSKYCSGFEFFGKAVLETLLIGCIVAALACIVYFVYKISGWCSTKHRESKMLEQMALMAEIDGQAFDKKAAK